MNPLSELSSFFYSIQQNPPIPDALATRVSSVASTFLSLATTEELPHIRTLIDRVSHSPDAFSSLQNFFMEKVLALHPSWMNREQKLEAGKHLLPCLTMLQYDAHIPDLLQSFSEIPQEQIPAFQHLICSLQSPTEKDWLQATISLCTELPFTRWRLARELCSSTEDIVKKISYLSTLQILNTIDNTDLENRIIEQFASIDPQCKLFILRALRFLPQDQILPAIAHWRTLDPNLHQYPLQLVNRWLANDPVHKDPLHAFLREELQTTRNGPWAHELSMSLTGFSLLFQLLETDPLYEEAEEIALLTANLTNPANPYTLYQYLIEMRKKPFNFSFIAPKALTPYGLWQINATQIASIRLDPIRRSALPQDVNRAAYESLWNNLNLRITNLDPTEKKATLRHIREMTNARFSYLREDSLSNEYLRSLFELPEKQEDPVSVETAYFFAILKKILDTSNEREEDALLSPQEEMLVKVACGIQNCPTGRAEGISSTYLMLIPLESQYQNCQAVGLSSQVKAWQFIWLIVHKLILEKLSSPGPLMLAYSGQLDPSQIAHYTLFLKNMIGQMLGISQTIEFDRYSGLLPVELIQKTREDLTTIFYQHVPPGEFTIVLQKAFQALSLEQKQQIAHSATELLAANPSLPQELMEGEDPEQNLIHITYNEDCTEVLDMTLSTKGAIHLLCAAGVLENYLSDSCFPLLKEMIHCLSQSPKKAAYCLHKLSPAIQKRLLDQITFFAEKLGVSIPPIDESLDLDHPVISFCMLIAVYDLILSEILDLERKEKLSIPYSITLLDKSVQTLIYAYAKKYCLEHHISEESSGQHSFFSTLNTSQHIEIIRKSQANLEKLLFLNNRHLIMEEPMLQYLDFAEPSKTPLEKLIFGTTIPFAAGIPEEKMRTIHSLFQNIPPSVFLMIGLSFTNLLAHIQLPEKANFITTILSLPQEEQLRTLDSLSYFRKVSNLTPSCYLDILQTIAEMPATSRNDAIFLSLEMIISDSAWMTKPPSTTDLHQSQPHLIVLCIKRLPKDHLPLLLQHLPVLFWGTEEKANALARVETLQALQHVPSAEIPGILAAIASCLPRISPSLFTTCIERLAAASQEERLEIMQAFSLLLSPDIKQSELFQAILSLPREHRSDVADKAIRLVDSDSEAILPDILRTLASMVPEEREQIIGLAAPIIKFYSLQEKTSLLSNLLQIPKNNREEVLSLTIQLFPPQESALCRTALGVIADKPPEQQLSALQIVQRVLSNASDRITLLASIVRLSSEQQTSVWNICHTACPANALHCLLALLAIPSLQRESVSPLLSNASIGPEEKLEFLHLLTAIPERDIPIFCQKVLQQSPFPPGMIARIVTALYSVKPKDRLSSLLHLLHSTSLQQKRKHGSL